MIKKRRETIKIETDIYHDKMCSLFCRFHIGVNMNEKWETLDEIKYEYRCGYSKEKIYKQQRTAKCMKKFGVSDEMIKHCEKMLKQAIKAEIKRKKHETL